MKNWPLQIPPDFDRRSNTSLITYISLQINVFYMYIQAKLGNDEFEPCLYLTFTCHSHLLLERESVKPCQNINKYQVHIVNLSNHKGKTP
jgi:hypothetical protein